MNGVKHTKPEFVSLKGHPEINEAWVVDRVHEDPSLLGLDGTLRVRDRERRQAKAGRLDLLLEDEESDTRYEVEFQLGETDPSHIIRCIEYWDKERKRSPDYDHVAVLVAEDISRRFFNVIQLFNDNIPLIAIKLVAIKFNDGVALQFIKVLDRKPPKEDEDEGRNAEPVDKSAWERGVGTESMTVVDGIYNLMRVLVPESELRYLKSKIALRIGGKTDWFVDFVPRKKFVDVWLHSQGVEDWVNRLREAGIDNSRTFDDGIVFRLTPEAFEKNKSLLEQLFKGVRAQSKGS